MNKYHYYRLPRSLQKSTLTKQKEQRSCEKNSLTRQEELLTFNHSLDFVERSDSKNRVKTEVYVPSKLPYVSLSQSIEKSKTNLKMPNILKYKKLAKLKISDGYELEEKQLSDVCLQHIIGKDQFLETPKFRNLTPLNKSSLEIPKSQSKSLNQRDDLLQFSFGISKRQNHYSEKQIYKFPKDVFMGDVRKVKKILQLHHEQ